MVAMAMSVWLIWAWGGQCYTNVMNLVSPLPQRDAEAPAKIALLPTARLERTCLSAVSGVGGREIPAKSPHEMYYNHLMLRRSPHGLQVGLTATPQYLQKLTYLCWNHDSRILQIDTVRCAFQLPWPHVLC